MGESARIVLPSGAVLTLVPATAALSLGVDAADEASLAEAKDVLEAHLDRFAFREAPLSYHWRV